ncbi:PKD domain-containing protein [Paenibacillus sp. CC-CFT747]|nr:PKD domain-containing protein [Paenibacillus sp. CC-CFT747]
MISLTSSGSYLVEYRSTDQAGNREELQSVTVEIDKNRAPQAFFNPSPSGRNAALLESGAAVVAVSSQYDGLHTPQAMLDYSAEPWYPWATTGLNNQWVRFSLAGGQTYLIDRIQIMPRIDYADQRVKDFEIAVSLDDKEYTTVLRATTANNGTLQEFLLQKPVLAKYVKYSPLSRHGAATVISTQQLKVMSGQEGGATVTFQNLSTDPDDDISSWSWDFGDGTTSTEKAPTHTFPGPGEYTVKLTATDATGKTGSFSLKQTVYAPAEPSFSHTPEVPNEAQAVTFTDTTAVPGGGKVVKRVWDFKDGTAKVTGKTNDMTVSHTFADNGSYTVTLEATDDRGLVTQAVKTITVNNLNPTIGAMANQWAANGQRVAFSPAISDPGRDRYTCQWDFGDGTTSTSCAFSHTYPNVADGAPDVTYTATLTVTDKDGGTAQASIKVTAYAPYLHPGTAISANDLFYTRHCTAPNVRKVEFSYDGTNQFILKTPATITSTAKADGLILPLTGICWLAARTTCTRSTLRRERRFKPRLTAARCITWPSTRAERRFGRAAFQAF